MKFGVVVFPGSNCDEDMVYVLGAILGQKVERLWHKQSDLKGVDMVVLPGGFSYGDYLRAGAIARFSPIMKSVIEFAQKGGYVFGVCNGFQVLCEAGLLPGVLLRNTNQKFVCQNTHVRVESTDSALTSSTEKGRVLRIPIAHSEGRYYADENTLRQLKQNDGVLFRYCDKNGQIGEDTNPNGSLDAIAGICNAQRNVFGMMPHPERAADKELRNTDGKILFESMLGLVSA